MFITAGQEGPSPIYPEQQHPAILGMERLN